MSTIPWLPNYLNPDNYFWGWIDVAIMIAQNLITASLDIVAFVVFFDRNRKIRRTNNFWRILFVHRVPMRALPGFDQRHPKGIMQEACDWMDSDDIPPEVVFRFNAWHMYKATYLKGWKPGMPRPAGSPSFEQYIRGSAGQAPRYPDKPQYQTYAPSPAVNASTSTITESGRLDEYQ